MQATYPGQFGLEPARRRCDALLVRAFAELDPLKANADALRWLARYIVERVH